MCAPAGFDPVELLVTLLSNIGRMDTDGFFEAPVREEDAPGYYDAIKRPMCFQKMKEKVGAPLSLTGATLAAACGLGGCMPCSSEYTPVM